MNGEKKRTDKHEFARNTLADELKHVFDQFVEDYKFAAAVHHGSPFVSYIVLAEMVKGGWRPSAEPIENWKGSSEKTEN